MSKLSTLKQSLKSSLVVLSLSLLSSLLGAQVTTPSISSFSQQNQSQPMPLELDQAFPFYVSELGPGQYRVTWDPAPGHYLYRHAFAFTMQQDAGSEALAVEYEIPPGIEKTDQFFGQIEAYFNHVSVDLNLPTVPRPGAELIIEYQGCAEWGFCYPPQKTAFALTP